MRALVVDDSGVMRKIVMNALAHSGIAEFEEACDGKEAVGAVMTGDYDIILLDWNMPNMLGIEAVKAIRAMGKQTPIIMVTTEAEKMRIIEALKAGANSYVIKPFQPAAILAKVQEVMIKAGTPLPQA